MKKIVVCAMAIVLILLVCSSARAGSQMSKDDVDVLLFAAILMAFVFGLILLMMHLNSPSVQAKNIARRLSKTMEKLDVVLVNVGDRDSTIRLEAVNNFPEFPYIEEDGISALMTTGNTETYCAFLARYIETIVAKIGPIAKDDASDAVRRRALDRLQEVKDRFSYLGTDQPDVLISAKETLASTVFALVTPKRVVTPARSITKWETITGSLAGQIDLMQRHQLGPSGTYMPVVLVWNGDGPLPHRVDISGSILCKYCGGIAKFTKISSYIDCKMCSTRYSFTLASGTYDSKEVLIIAAFVYSHSGGLSNRPPSLQIDEVMAT